MSDLTGILGWGMAIAGSITMAAYVHSARKIAAAGDFEEIPEPAKVPEKYNASTLTEYPPVSLDDVVPTDSPDALNHGPTETTVLRGTFTGRGMYPQEVSDVCALLDETTLLVHPKDIKKDPRWPTNFVPRTYMKQGVAIHVPGDYQRMEVIGQSPTRETVTEWLISEKPYLTERW